MKVDETWFKNKIEEKFSTQASFAEKMSSMLGVQFDQPKLSKTIKGVRLVQVAEVYAMAKLLDISVVEIMTRLGFKLGEDGRPKR